MTTSRRCPTCAGPIERRPGIAGRWPAYCSRDCRPQAVRDRALIAGGAPTRACRGCGRPFALTSAAREWCTQYCAVTFWQARYRADRELRRALEGGGA